MRFLWTPVTFLFALGVLLSFFQNCTPAVPYGNTDYYSELVSSAEFPYEVGIDQVAYLSCSEQENIFNDGTFFTFRAGAYSSQGLRISESFRKSTTKLSGESVVSALEQSESSAGTQIQLGIRTLDNLQLLYVDQANGDEGLEDSDYTRFFPYMGEEGLASLLWYMEPGDYVRYWAGAQFVKDYRFEGDLQFMKSQIMESNLRSFLNARGVLAVTFAEPGEITPLGPDLSALQEHVYGMAVQPKFKQSLFMKRTYGTSGNNPNHFREVNPGSDIPPRVLSSISEVKIDERRGASDIRPWSCLSSMSFMIVLPEDAQAEVPLRDSSGNIRYESDGVTPRTHTVTRCKMQSDPANPSIELQLIRQSLYAQDWYIDMDRKCIVPKPDHTQAGSCYGVDGNGDTVKINYETPDTEGCGQNNTNGVCPHYASICFRQ